MLRQRCSATRISLGADNWARALEKKLEEEGGSVCSGRNNQKENAAEVAMPARDRHGCHRKYGWNSEGGSMTRKLWKCWRWWMSMSDGSLSSEVGNPSHPTTLVPTISAGELPCHSIGSCDRLRWRPPPISCSPSSHAHHLRLQFSSGASRLFNPDPPRLTTCTHLRPHRSLCGFYISIASLHYSTLHTT